MSEPSPMSDANREALGSMNAVQFSGAAWLASVHYEKTQPGQRWAGLTGDEQAEAILAAHPYFLAAREIFNELREQGRW